ncbi:MAG: hypothetical protein ACOCP8_07085 [archaeon]
MNKEKEKVIKKVIDNKRITHIFPQAVERNLDYKYNRQEVEKVLDHMADKGKIERLKKPICPVCTSSLDEEDEEYVCYNCVREFTKDEIYHITEYKVSK